MADKLTETEQKRDKFAIVFFRLNRQATGKKSIQVMYKPKFISNAENDLKVSLP
jgi:hypothetical protein